MSRSSYDFNFEHALKPCDVRDRSNPQCVDNAKKECPYFQMCDLVIKNPPEVPTINWRTVTKLTFG